MFVIVAHDSYRFREYITKVYDVKDGDYREVDDIDAYIEENYAIDSEAGSEFDDQEPEE